MRLARSYFRLFALGACALLLVPFGISAAPLSLHIFSRKHHVGKQGSGDYTDSPGPVDPGGYPLVDATTRGFYYQPDDLSAFNVSDQVEAGTMTMPSDPGYVSSGTQDTGDDLVLIGRPTAVPRSDSPPTGLFLGYPLKDLLASIDPAPLPKAAEASSLPTLNELFSRLKSVSKRQQQGPDVPTGPGVPTPGTSSPRAGEAFPWEGFGPGGGSSAATGYVNTQTGNRLTVMPIVGWSVPGGMKLDLTLYHNSQDNLDVGWGMNWRSSFDMRLVFSGTYSQGTNKVTVTYPTGKRTVFTNSNPLASNVWYPPTGFYDVVSRQFNNNAHPMYLRTRDQFTYGFDIKGYLITIQDRYANRITINRNSIEAITSVSDSYGNSLTFTLTPGPFLHYQTVTSPLSAVYTFNYAGQYYYPNVKVLRSAQFPGTTYGGTQTFETFGYDINAGIVSEIARDGNIFRNTYDSTERQTSFSYSVPFYTNPITQAGNQGNLTYRYSYASTSTTFTDPYGKTSVDNYDGGTLHSQVDEQGYSHTFWYDINYNCNQFRSERQYNSTYGYDSYGNMLWSQDPIQAGAAKKSQFAWNSWNDLLTQTDSRGAITKFNRDPTFGYVLSVQDGLNNTLVTNTYASTGQLSTSSSKNATTSVTYDTAFRPTTIQTPNRTYTLTYGTLQHLPNMPTGVMDGTGNTATIGYDAWGRATSVSRSYDGNAATITLDPMNRMTDSYDWLTNPSHYVYDAAGRLVSAHTPDGATEYYRWWDAARLAGIVDGNNHTRSYAYTVRGEMKGFTLADGQGEAYQFDGDGNQTSRTNGLYQYTTYAFDANDNQTSTTYPNGPGVSYAYDYDGRMTSMIDWIGTTGWVYDLADRLTNFNSPQGNLTYSYDQWGRRTLLTVGSTATLQYGYTANRLTSLVSLPQSETTSWDYDSFGRVFHQFNSNGTKVAYGYDGLGRLGTLAHTTSSSGNILSESYGYDANSNLTSRTTNGTSTQYVYDGLGQLTYEEPNPGGPNGNNNIRYTYDLNGNRTSKTVFGAYIDSYFYDAGDKLLNVQRNTGGGNTPLKTYGYDGGGRTTSVQNNVTGATTNLTYDYEDRVSTIQIPGISTTNQFSYNAFDARVRKVDSGGTSNYLRAGAGATSSVLSDGSASYVPGVSRHTASGTRTYHQNFIGSNSAETDASQNTQATRTHDAFGAQVASSGSPSGPFGFAGGFGYQEDGDSGLRLLGHRFYDSAIGRFITRDPAYMGRNTYVYVGNCPLIAVDFSGLKKAVIVLLPVEPGYQTGLQNACVGQMLEYLHAEGYKDEDISFVNANEDQIVEAAADADFLGFIGHGAGDGAGDEKGCPVMDGDVAFDDSSIAHLIAARGGRRLPMVWLMCCYSNNQWQKWLNVANNVWSYGPLNGVSRFFANKKSLGGRQHAIPIPSFRGPILKAPKIRRPRLPFHA